MERASCRYVNNCDRFKVKQPAPKHDDDKKPTKEVHEEQYFHLYQHRLNVMKQRLIDRARVVLKDTDIPLRSIPELAEGERCLLVGTLIKRQQLRPSVLKEICDELGESLQVVGHGWYVSDSDSIAIEDEHLNVALQGNIDIGKLVTGVVVAACGVNSSGGVFEVEKLIFPPIGPQKPLKSCDTGTRFILFISGLEFTSSGEDGDLFMACKVLVDFVTGLVGTEEDLKLCTSRICRMIIAGNCISTKQEEAEFSRLASYQTRSMETPSVKAVKHLDAFLSELTPVIPVDVMPGSNDPTNYLWPQCPLHKCMFPLSGTHQGQLNLVSNPYSAEYDDCLIMGTSGENVRDIMSNSRLDTPIRAMREMFRWQHIAPTAPDTLDCQPLKEDVFVMSPSVDSPTPHVMFAGSQSQAAYKMLKHPDGQRTMLLSLPNFSLTKQAVLLDIESMQVEVIDCNRPVLSELGEK